MPFNRSDYADFLREIFLHTNPKAILHLLTGKEKPLRGRYYPMF